MSAPRNKELTESGTVDGHKPIAVSIAQACQISGLSRATIFRCIAAGRLPTRKLGSRTLIIVEELRSFLTALPKGGAR
ncbi:MAG: helix-turn-helix domain-containing protein [Phreatobacter sp.]|uniref:helix-turn-helix domain-containing protein n=1 Tax=Phreatobacter sp. TaxID=1966341 RepID=UPI001A5645BD|nr:helix-turn-helix domain-containing protein [Phreatobacter sp.]